MFWMVEFWGRGNTLKFFKIKHDNCILFISQHFDLNIYNLNLVFLFLKCKMINI